MSERAYIFIVRDYVVSASPDVDEFGRLILRVYGARDRWGAPCLARYRQGHITIRGPLGAVNWRLSRGGRRQGVIVAHLDAMLADALERARLRAEAERKNGTAKRRRKTTATKGATS